MKTIHKLCLRDAWNHLTDGRGCLYTLPFGARIVLAQEQQGDPHIWYEFDTPEIKAVPVTFLIVGTGHAVSMGWTHVQSYIATSFVWHLYQKGL